jgi:hypothetical protein
MIMPTPSNERVPLVLALLFAIAASGCATREYLTAPSLQAIQQRDPQLHLVRVYPSLKFVSYYERELGQDVSVGGTQGEVQTDYRAQRLEIPFAKSLPGAIVDVGEHEGMPLLWVTFDRQCVDKRCALGFVLSHDQLYRLVHVPKLAGFSEPAVYRRRVVQRQRMERSKIYSKTKGAAVYLTTTGVIASVALQFKKQRRVDIETLVVPQSGVPAGASR